jgi:hypothetical protein
VSHLYRRKALYYWRRRLPLPLRSWFHKRHLFMRIADPTFARRLVVLLDAKLEEIVTAFEQSAMHLTPPQVDGLLRDVVTAHLNKLERLSAAAKSFPEFDPTQAERDDRRAAWSYRLLHAQGPSAVVRPSDEEHMSADGMTATDIAAVQDHLAMLRINNLVPTRHGILQKLLDANGAPANAMNLATAQDVYFRGMWMALAQSERRYGGKIVEADDFMEQVFRDRLRPAPSLLDDDHLVQSRPTVAAVPDPPGITCGRHLRRACVSMPMRNATGYRTQAQIRNRNRAPFSPIVCKSTLLRSKCCRLYGPST